jgi:general stress protein 26
MTEPVTTIDSRYSSPTAIAATWAQTVDVLDSAELFWVVTVRADGRPHATPVTAAWFEGAVWFSTGSEEQKFINLRANSDVIIMTGCNSWDKGLDVIVEGEAVQVTDDARLARAAQAFVNKWDGRWQFTVRDGGFRDEGSQGAEVFAVTPTKVFAHKKGDPFGATTHRFSPKK